MFNRPWRAGLLPAALILAACSQDMPTEVTAPKPEYSLSHNNVSISNTAEGVNGGGTTYDWTLTKTVTPTSSSLTPGASVTLNYTLVATRTGTPNSGQTGVKGQVCIKNDNNFNVTVLKVEEVLEVKVFGSAAWEAANIEGNPWITQVDFSANPIIGPNSTNCYNYFVPFTPKPGSEYRSWGSAETSETPFPYFDIKTLDIPSYFTIPAGGSSDVDALASLNDVLTCPAGFTCQQSGVTFPITLTGSQTLNYAVKVTNVNAPCSSSHSVKNTATITESNTGQQHTASQTSTISTGPCSAVCTATQGGWGQGASGRNIGWLRDTYWTTVYPSGVNVGTSSRYIRFTSAAAVEAFLPAGGGLGQLDKSYTNPTTSPAKTFGGQVTSLRLNVDFSNKGVGGWKPGIATAIINVPGPFFGKTVTQLLASAQAVLAGGAVPTGMSLGDLNDLVSAVNGMNTPDGCDIGDTTIQRKY